MRVRYKDKRRGFTLVELMIVVAIIGVLAALAIFGVNRYLKSAKTSEAKLGIGQISKSAAESYGRETVVAEVLQLGTESAQSVHQLCDDAVAVPSQVPAARKYQPNNSGTADYKQGNSTAGWQCLSFVQDDPTYFQYDYQHNSTDYCTSYGCTPSTQPNNFEAAAIGDLDGDGDYSAFILTGQVDDGTKQLVRATAVHIYSEFE